MTKNNVELAFKTHLSANFGYLTIQFFVSDPLLVEIMHSGQFLDQQMFIMCHSKIWRDFFGEKNINIWI